MTAYSDLKTAITAVYDKEVVAGGFIESDSGSPTQLAVFLDLVHSRIVGHPTNWPFTRVVGTVTSTGATSYDLKTLFPDFLSVYQVYGIDTDQEHVHLSNADANVMPVEGWTIRNGQLIFAGQVPGSGSTFKIQYKSQYLVEDASGARKRYFENDDDQSVLSGADINVLIFGLGEFVQWKSDEMAQQTRESTRRWSTEAWTNMMLRDEAQRPLTSLL